MKKRSSKSKKKVLLTAFCMIFSTALSGQTVSVLAKEADTEKHETAFDFWTVQEDLEQKMQGQNDAGKQQEDQNPEEQGQKDKNPEEQSGQEDSSNPQGQGDSSNPQGQTGQGDSSNPQEDPGQNEDNHPEGGSDHSSQGQSDEVQQNEQDPDKDKEEIVLHVDASIKLANNGKNASISWKSVQGAAAYKIQRSNKKNEGFKNISSLEEDTCKYTDKSVVRGSRYFYRIAVKMENSRTIYSDVLSFTCPLGKVSNVRLVQYSTSSIKVIWDKSKDKQTEYYKVYYAKGKSGDYKLAGVTQNTWYRVKELDNNQDYYFQVKACAAKKASKLDSELSGAASMRTKPYNRTTIFAGDSITVGLRSYNILNEIAIGGNKGIVAAVGLNTTTFRTRRVFDGKSGLESIVAAKPYRVYIMLGDNEIHYRSKEDTVAGFREILKGIKAGSPDTDIVVLAATPVTSKKVAQSSGFAQIPAYNQSLKALAKSMGARYFDCTDFLKDSSGWLKSSYAAGDGVHWTASAYHEYGKRLEAYDKSLD